MVTFDRTLPTLADDEIRLVPLSPAHELQVTALVDDEESRRYTRIPTEPPADFVPTWLRSYDEGRADGTRLGFAIESHEGEFLGFPGTGREFHHPRLGQWPAARTHQKARPVRRGLR